MISVLLSDSQFRGGWDPTKVRGLMPGISVEAASGVIFEIFGCKGLLVFSVNRDFKAQP